MRKKKSKKKKGGDVGVSCLRVDGQVFAEKESENARCTVPKGCQPYLNFACLYTETLFILKVRNIKKYKKCASEKILSFY